MARPVRVVKTRVYAAPGVTLYHGILRARPGQPISVPADHAAALEENGRGETVAAKAVREAAEAAAPKAAAAKGAAAAPAEAEPEPGPETVH